MLNTYYWIELSLLPWIFISQGKPGCVSEQILKFQLSHSTELLDGFYPMIDSTVSTLAGF